MVVKKFTVAAIAVLFTLVSFAQLPSFSKANWKEGKYYISCGYGTGEAWWFSKFENADLFDKNGSVIKSGNSNFSAKNTTSIRDMNVMFPIAKVRVGMGICFETFFLDKLDLKATNENTIVLFDETFNFDKIYLLAEYQFLKQYHSAGSISAQMRLGYFGYNGINRINFFGDDAMAKKYFGTLGIVAEYRLFPHVYSYLLPCFEYKYFKNSADEQPANIWHNILTTSIVAGLRIDISKD